MKKSGLLLITAAVLLFAVIDVSADGDGITHEESGGLFAVLSSSSAIENALDNLGTEMSERLNTMPFSAIGLLGDSLTHGTTSLDYELREEWISRNNETRISTVLGNLSFHSDADNMDYALRVSIADRDENLDFDAYLNSERFAIGSSLLGDVYGINFDTFSQDILRLTREAGFPDDTFQLLYENSNVFRASTRRFIGGVVDGESRGILGAFSSLNMPAFSSNDELNRAFIDFAQSIETVTERVESMDARRITYSFTDASLANLITDILNIMENDENIRSRLEDLIRMPGVSIEDIYYELREGIRGLEQEIDGIISVSFLIGQRDRLLRIELAGSFNDDSYDFNAALDFGVSATDVWRFDFSYNSGSTSLIWETRETPGRNIHDITTVREGRRTETSTLTSDWDMSSGDFSIFVSESGRNREIISGNLVVSDGTFRFRFEHSAAWDGGSVHLVLSIHTARDANIGSVNFRDIGEMSFEEIDGILHDVFDISIQEEVRIFLLRNDVNTLTNALNMYNNSVMPDQWLTSIPAHENGRFVLVVRDGQEVQDFSVQFNSAERAAEVVDYINTWHWDESRAWFSPDFGAIYGSGR